MENKLFILLLFLLISCFGYDDVNARKILEKKMVYFCSQQKVDCKGGYYQFDKYKIGSDYQYNLTLYKVKGKDTLIITCTLFSDNGDVKVIEVKNLEKFK
ncbi:hypothetical protein BPO_2395 [Bergeyella porcorum]|uniref:DUF4377 domain-containing protein n=1 Tax=Bergeyella porcorum TaxID=1735111 RepID=A0AAU0F4H0_9FLAO